MISWPLLRIPAAPSRMSIAALVVSLMASIASAQGRPADSSSVVKVRVFPASESVAPGSDLPIAIELAVDSGWHIWTNKGANAPDVSVFDGAVFTSIGVKGLPPGIDLHLPFAQWPVPDRVESDLGEGHRPYAVFEGKRFIYLPATVATSVSGDVSFDLTVDFQACDESNCRAPAQVSLPVKFSVQPGAAVGALSAAFSGFAPAVYGQIHAGEAAPANVPFEILDWRFTIDTDGFGFMLLLVAAALGGLLLNFTPCVLPVIPLKIMGLAQAAGDRGRCARLGLAMCAGVIAFWLALAVAIVGITGFDAANSLFQYRPFTIGVGVFIAIMAVGMAGFFSIQLPQWVYMIEPKHDSYKGSFGFGILTAVLSTPCTAPFMGSAAGWAAEQGDAGQVLAVFGAIGFGMALPYGVLASFPALVGRMPRTGPASEVIKQVMGLLLLAGAAYFIGSGINGYRDEPSELYWWLIAGLGVAGGAWVCWRTVKIAKRMAPRVVLCGIGAVLMLLSAAVGVLATYEPVKWVTWSAEAEAEALKEHKVVVIDFTAEWCGNCKFLEATVLHSDSVAEQLNAKDVAALKVDLTKGLPERQERLTKAGRITIPLLLVIDRNGREVMKSDTYTPSQVLQAIEAARGAAAPAPGP